MKFLKFLIALIYANVVFYTAAFSQNLVNNGNGIVINNGAYLVIGGKYINRNATQDGFVDNDGNMIVYGDFINNATNNVFVNIESNPDGKTIMPALSQQSISGTNTTRFENLKVSGGIKNLDANHAMVAGNFILASVFKLNSHTLELEKSSPLVLDHPSGYLMAETEPSYGLGILRWNLNDQGGTYNIPFGSGMASNNDINLTIKVVQCALGNGAINFSTYPTNSSNVPLPDFVSSLEPYDPEVTVNRFWLIDAEHSTKPSVEITFKYTDIDANSILENTLGAIRYNCNAMAWDDFLPNGVADVIENTVTTNTVAPNDFFKNWTLTGSSPEDYIYIPNSFTPNGDGNNEWFAPIIGNDELLSDYSFMIFDRWGSMVFSSTTQDKGWDGMREGIECQQDVYVWVFGYRDIRGSNVVKMGKVTLIR